jgi:hypothetical protein
VTVTCWQGCPGLAAYLAQMPDPRDPRGVRHTLTSLLLAAVGGAGGGALVHRNW